MKIIAFGICFILLFSLAAFCRAADPQAWQFPLEKGSYWIYKGEIKWTPEGSETKSKVLTWMMTVHEVMQSAEYRIALVSGFPNDVAWYEGGMKPQYSLLVEDGKCIYWEGYKTRDEAMDAARTIAASPQNRMANLKCIMEFPLIQGKKYDAMDENRSDIMYAWYVEEVEKVTLKVKGYADRGPVNRYRLVYRTLPDHIIMEFVPGLGITRYLYEHHGTVAFEDLRLVEYSRKKP